MAFLFFFLKLHRMDLSLSKANKTKNSLAKFLYECVFQNVVCLINTSLSSSSELDETIKLRINMLDIAGFGTFIKIIAEEKLLTLNFY